MYILLTKGDKRWTDDGHYVIPKAHSELIRVIRNFALQKTAKYLGSAAKKSELIGRPESKSVFKLGRKYKKTDF